MKKECLKTKGRVEEGWYKRGVRKSKRWLFTTTYEAMRSIVSLVMVPFIFVICEGMGDFSRGGV